MNFTHPHVTTFASSHVMKSLASIATGCLTRNVAKIYCVKAVAKRATRKPIDLTCRRLTPLPSVDMEH